MAVWMEHCHLTQLRSITVHKYMMMIHPPAESSAESWGFSGEQPMWRSVILLSFESESNSSAKMRNQLLLTELFTGVLRVLYWSHRSQAKQSFGKYVHCRTLQRSRVRIRLIVENLTENFLEASVCCEWPRTLVWSEGCYQGSISQRGFSFTREDVMLQTEHAEASVCSVNDLEPHFGTKVL